MLYRKLKLLLVFLLIATWCDAQSFLALDHIRSNGIKRTRYMPGDEIIYSMKGETIKYRGTIDTLGDGGFEIEGTFVEIKDIDVVYKDKRKSFSNKIAKTLLGAGILFPVFDIGNNLIFHHLPILKARAFIIGGAIALTGLTIKLLIKQKYKL